MLTRLQARIPPELAEYLNNLLSAAFFGLALVALLYTLVWRGPRSALERAVP